jgi:hypothetical protein
LASSIFSSVVVSGFLGMEILHDTIEDLPAHEYALETATLIYRCSFEAENVFLRAFPYRWKLRKEYVEIHRRQKILMDFYRRKLAGIRHEFESRNP